MKTAGESCLKWQCQQLVPFFIRSARKAETVHVVPGSSSTDLPEFHESALFIVGRQFLSTSGETIMRRKTVHYHW